MIITCQECDSRFVLDDKLIKPTGTKVRCSSCKHVFKAFPKAEVLDEPEESVAPAESAAPPQPSHSAAPAAASPKNLDEGDDLAEELDRELDRLFGLDGNMFDDEPAAPAAEVTPPPAAKAPRAAAPKPPPKVDDPPVGNLDDLNLDDLDLEGLEMSGEASAADDLDLSDLELDLSFDDDVTPAPAASAQDSMDEDLDFSDLEISLADEAPAQAAAEEELDFSGFEASDDDLPVATAAPEAVVEELDLGDLGAVLSEIPEESAASNVDSLTDVDLSLDVGDDIQMVSAELSSDSFDEDLDFSDLEASLTDDATPLADALAADPMVETTSEVIDFGEMDLSLDGDASADVSSALAGEMEFSLDGTGDMELSLDLDLDEELAVEASAVGGGFADDGEMLLDLDLDLDDDEPMRNPVSATEEELDLSDLESLLTDDSGLDAPLSGDDDIELELDFNFETQTKTEEIEPMNESADFSDIEAMLEEDKASLNVADELGDEVDLDLELDLFPEMESASEPAMAGMPKMDTAASVSSIPSMETVEFDDTAVLDEDVEKRPVPKRTAHGSGSKGGNAMKIVLTLLLVIFFLFAILVSVYALKDEIRDRTGIAIPSISAVESLRETLGGMGIPYVSELVKPPVKDLAGVLFLSTQEVSGRFVTSPGDGDLFVISGSVKSGYPDVRNSIRLTGRLFAADNREVQTKEFYAGNNLTDDELSTLTMEEIDQRLKTTLGINNSNARVRPGQIIPFVVVFSKLPDNLSEFAVEVSGSLPGAAIK